MGCGNLGHNHLNGLERCVDALVHRIGHVADEIADLFGLAALDEGDLDQRQSDFFPCIRCLVGGDLAALILARVRPAERAQGPALFAKVAISDPPATLAYNGRAQPRVQIGLAQMLR